MVIEMPSYRDKDLEIKKLPKGYRVASDRKVKKIFMEIEKRYHKLFEALARI